MHQMPHQSVDRRVRGNDGMADVNSEALGFAAE